jgi:hypothetical protein
MIEHELQFFGVTRKKTLQMLEGLTQSQIDFKPAPNRWSVGETVDHILLACQLGISQFKTLIDLQKTGREPYLRVTFADVNVAPVFMPKSLLPFFEIPFAVTSMFTPRCVKDFLIGNRMFAAKNPDVAEPRYGRSVNELKNELNTSLQELENLFAVNPDMNYEAMKISHPVFGVYDAPGYVRFMAQHEQRHQAQIAEVLSAVSSFTFENQLT